jgi:hypothetical protein
VAVRKTSVTNPGPSDDNLLSPDGGMPRLQGRFTARSLLLMCPFVLRRRQIGANIIHCLCMTRSAVTFPSRETLFAVARAVSFSCRCVSRYPTKYNSLPCPMEIGHLLQNLKRLCQSCLVYYVFSILLIYQSDRFTAAVTTSSHKRV